MLCSLFLHARGVKLNVLIHIIIPLHLQSLLHIPLSPDDCVCHGDPTFNKPLWRGGGDEISPDRIPSLLTYINRKVAPNTGGWGGGDGMESLVKWIGEMSSTDICTVYSVLVSRHEICSRTRNVEYNRKGWKDGWCTAYIHRLDWEGCWLCWRVSKQYIQATVAYIHSWL